ncbi:MAG: hypothetical protein GX329_03325 [Tissierellia bacterium]|nr:hypothetical protein [Tissierellia bacterium]
MKKSLIIIMLILSLLLTISNRSYAMDKKSIMIILDEWDLDDVSEVFSDRRHGVGFMNLKTRRPYSPESLYFSIAMGRKVGVESGYYRGLYRDVDDRINIIGFRDMLDGICDLNNMDIELLGNKLGNEAISYIGNDSSAIIGADARGRIGNGEIELIYDLEWLVKNTNDHLAESKLLILSYDIDGRKERLDLLKYYMGELEGISILVIPKSVPVHTQYIINRNLVPIVYIDEYKNGVIQSLSTNRRGFITLEDISVELLANGGGERGLEIGNTIDIVEEEDNIFFAKAIMKRIINLMLIVYLFHGLVYIVQVYSAYQLLRGERERFQDIHFYNNIIIINIFISLLMGASNLHINIALYLFINLLTTYLITVFMMGRAVNPIGLFATLTYMLIIFGIFLEPEIIYNSYIGFNNLCYGVRYYGLNNGIMGVLLSTSIISYLFIRELISNRYVDRIICFCYFMLNIIALSANYGANTGGFLTATILFLMMLYVYILDRKLNIGSIFILASIGLSIFITNMYFDYFSSEKSHAIDFLLRLKTFGIGELVHMYRNKIGELIKLTILPPFSVTIIAQIYSLYRLSKLKGMVYTREFNIMLTIGITAFLLNDTGAISFIFIMHYLLSLQIYHSLSPSS